MTPSGCQHSFAWTASQTGPFTPPEFFVSTCGFCGTMAIWENGAWKVGQETLGSLAIGNAERLGLALQQVFALLGPSDEPCPECRCAGCEHERGEAVRVIREALGLTT